MPAQVDGIGQEGGGSDAAPYTPRRVRSQADVEITARRHTHPTCRRKRQLESLGGEEYKVGKLGYNLIQHNTTYRGPFKIISPQASSR
jgi:hypothetical protein